MQQQVNLSESVDDMVVTCILPVQSFYLAV